MDWNALRVAVLTERLGDAASLLLEDREDGQLKASAGDQLAEAGQGGVFAAGEAADAAGVGP